jgi:hypothetical protein
MGRPFGQTPERRLFIVKPIIPCPSISREIVGRRGSKLFKLSEPSERDPLSKVKQIPEDG